MGNLNFSKMLGIIFTLIGFGVIGYYVVVPKMADEEVKPGDTYVVSWGLHDPDPFKEASWDTVKILAVKAGYIKFGYLERGVQKFTQSCSLRLFDRVSRKIEGKVQVYK